MSARLHCCYPLQPYRPPVMQVNGSPQHCKSREGVKWGASICFTSPPQGVPKFPSSVLILVSSSLPHETPGTTCHALHCKPSDRSHSLYSVILLNPSPHHLHPTFQPPHPLTPLGPNKLPSARRHMSYLFDHPVKPRTHTRQTLFSVTSHQTRLPVLPQHRRQVIHGKAVDFNERSSLLKKSGPHHIHLRLRITSPA